jgi:Domain of unknown function (DUF6484)
MSDLELSDILLEAGVDESCDAPHTERVPKFDAVRIGLIVGFIEEGRTPLVIFPGQISGAAVAARSTLDLSGEHVGRNVVLAFADGDSQQPIVIGCLQNDVGLAEKPGQVEIDADGERMVVTAKERIVLRCGKASITLTKSGKILIDGVYVSSHSSGVNRIKGGSVQIN